ncbi:MAG: phosphotransferase [Colwellia sp.]|nr:phosphotransferase [Colwellia sp.]
MQRALATLTCFNRVESISAIATGLSQKCYKVNADNNVYFAKTIHGKTEINIALKAAEQGFSPAIFYYDENWLVTTFIKGASENKNLALASIYSCSVKDNNKGNEKKITLALQLMSKCHQLNVRPEKLNPEKLIRELIDQSNFLPKKKKELLRVAESILAPLNTTTNTIVNNTTVNNTTVNLVCCHGDLNFSNVLVVEQKATWLVDYECACLAPAEYDLAMFIAVNNIEQDQVLSIIKYYQQQNIVTIDHQLLDAYQLFCYFINGLWYFNKNKVKKNKLQNQREDKQLLTLAKQQWQRFNEINKCLVENLSL